MKAPKYVGTAINSASAPLGSRRLFINDTRAQEWITRHFGLFTDDNRQTLNGEAINFDWLTQRWYIELPGQETSQAAKI